MTLHWSSSAGRNLGIGKCCCKALSFDLPKATNAMSSIKFHAHLALGSTLAKLRDPLLLGEKNT